ncbi:MAG TPA: helix-turn-helix domain-containing protein [Kutzneria sp.]
MTSERTTRADAVRNSERILRATRDVFADLGPDAPLEEVARRAGVGIRTVYRHFPRKDDLLQAVVNLNVTEDLAAAIERAEADDNPLRGLVGLVEATLALTARDRNIVTAVSNSTVITCDGAAPLRVALAELIGRAQQAGLVRADVTAEDVLQLLMMLTSVAYADDGWRRYVALVLDALSPAGASPLPPASSTAMSCRAFPLR